ncbi:MAG: amidohydrolase family protein [Betaproteobacteria bacterium]|nr:amidohydrolase family protein [Betaproteobacteria bacterium]
MNRRLFLAALTAFAAPAMAGWVRKSPLGNPCKPGLPDDDEVRALLARTWEGLDPTRVWDVHAHLTGVGDGGKGVWISPEMETWRHPTMRARRDFLLNASCADAAPGAVDAAYVAHLARLMGDHPAGAKILLFAFDHYHGDDKLPQPRNSTFFIHNDYARDVARAHPDRFEWAASIHPYRDDCVPALETAAAAGARAVKWLPTGQNIDPASPRCDNFYAALARLDLPLIVHVGAEATVKARHEEFGNPLRLRRALDARVRVVAAHCASHGQDRDERGRKVPSFDLFTRLMCMPEYAGRLFGDISAMTQNNRSAQMQTVLARNEWHGRLLNGSDYPLPGARPLISLRKLAHDDLLDPALIAPLDRLRNHNALLFDLALKRHLAWEGKRLPASVFQTRDFFRIA